MDAKIQVIVGVVIEGGGRYLLVQEAQEKCRGKWNLPAGHLVVRHGRKYWSRNKW